MQPHVRMREQEGAHGLGLMRREIVGDHMNLSPLRLTGHDVAEKVDKGGAGVPRHGLTEDFTRLGIQGREERQRTVPVVFEAVSLGASGRKWQHRVKAVERLNGRFSSTAKTAAWSGGLTYRPITSAAFGSKSGSSDCM